MFRGWLIGAVVGVVLAEAVVIPTQPSEALSFLIGLLFGVCCSVGGMFWGATRWD